MITYEEYFKSVLKQEALTDYPDIKSAAQKAFDLEKKAIVAAAKKSAKSSTGAFTPARAAAKAKADLLKKIYAKKEPPIDDEKILKLAIESNETFLDYLDYIEESSNFINSLVDKEGVTKAKAEKAWDIAAKAFKTGKFKKVKGDKKYKIIAGLAKKIVKEDGEVGMGVSDVTGSAINTTNVGGQFAAKLGENPNEPGKYSPNSSNMFTRYSSYGKKKKKKKTRKESVEVDNFVDNLFE